MPAYDVIVVGSGPAGATAAYCLGAAGRRVLVLEKAHLPRYKACGGGLSVRMLASHFPFAFDPVIEARVRRVAFGLGDRLVHVPLTDDAVCTVMRDRLDAYILDHARADVLQDIVVDRVIEGPDTVRVIGKDGRAFEGRFVVGADGANSTVARSVGLRRGKTTAAAIEVEAPASPEVLRRFGDALCFIFGEVPFGYLWIFPKAEHLSVGIGALRPRPGQLQATLRRVMARYGVSFDDVPLHGHPIPIYLRKERLATRRVALVGDAAGLADPVTGEGIRLAIKSGRLAAAAIEANALDRYERDVFRQIGRSHALGTGLAWLFCTFPRAWFRVGAGNPLITQAFVDMLSDRAGYGLTALVVFGSTPVYLALEAALGMVGAVLGRDRAYRLRRAARLGVASPIDRRPRGADTASYGAVDQAPSMTMAREG